MSLTHVYLYNASFCLVLVQRSVHQAGRQGSSHGGLLWSRSDRPGEGHDGPNHQVSGCHILSLCHIGSKMLLNNIHLQYLPLILDTAVKICQDH